MTKKTILVTGGDGRFAQELKKYQSNYNLILRNKKQLNICSVGSIKSNIKKYKPNYLIHLAGLSRPMKVHKDNIEKSIQLNIIGTCNLVKECSRKNIKIIYFSTNYIMKVQKEIIRSLTLYYLGIIMVGQNLVVKVQSKCIKIH